jgi:hypothetical protein
MLKNSVQSVLTENGIVLSAEEKKLLLSKSTGLYFLEKLDISEASRISIRMSLSCFTKILSKINTSLTVCTHRSGKIKFYDDIQTGQ